MSRHIHKVEMWNNKKIIQQIFHNKREMKWNYKIFNFIGDLCLIYFDYYCILILNKNIKKKTWNYKCQMPKKQTMKSLEIANNNLDRMHKFKTLPTLQCHEWFELWMKIINSYIVWIKRRFKWRFVCGHDDAHPLDIALSQFNFEFQTMFFECFSFFIMIKIQKGVIITTHRPWQLYVLFDKRN